MPKVVMVPIDVTQTGTAANALAMARKLLDPQDDKLILLNVVEELPTYVAAQVPANILKEIVSHARNTLTQIVEDHKLPPETEILVTDGYASRKILDVAKERHADVIVIASHDPGIADYLLGSVASRVVRHAHCSVLVVRNVTK